MSVLVSPPPPPRLRRWAAACLDLIFPPACAHCGRYGYRICPRCAQLVEPVPQILAAMDDEDLDAAALADRLAGDFDLGERDAATALIAERLEELAELGLVDRIVGA